MIWPFIAFTVMVVIVLAWLERRRGPMPWTKRQHDRAMEAALLLLRRSENSIALREILQKILEGAK